MTWKDDQTWESKWWGNCTNTFFEELKQLQYAKKMGLLSEQLPDERFPVFDMKGKTILDIGGGAVSLLLKCINFKSAVIIDPCDYPAWTYKRYQAAGIEFIKGRAEDYIYEAFDKFKYDEAWIYNCLQHTEDPEKIIQNAKKAAKVIRIFEWLDRGVMPGHPQDLKEDKLNKWIGQKGKVEQVIIGNVNYGMSYSGVFKT